MALTAIGAISLQFRGDGSSTSLTVDLENVTFTDGANHPENLLRPENLPTGVQSALVDGSSSGFTTSLTGTELTLTFSSAPSSIVHSLTVNFTFAGF